MYNVTALIGGDAADTPDIGELESWLVRAQTAGSFNVSFSSFLEASVQGEFYISIL